LGGRRSTQEKIMETSSIPTGVLYSMSMQRWRYARTPDALAMRIDSHWFVQRLHKHLGGKSPIWTGSGYSMGEDSKDSFKKAQQIMREFCSLSDEEVEDMLVSRSVVEASRYSIKVKNQRLLPGPEGKFLERCKGMKSRTSSLLSYCGHWDIMPENMTEITMIAGFEGGNRGRMGEIFIKKLTANKRKCKELLAQIMKLEGIAENEPISTIMARLG
jgi:hypothetical protein